MALHRDIYWVGRQWAVTGFGVQAVDLRLHGAFDIEASLVWEDDLPERMRTHAWVNREDFDRALALARQRFAAPRKTSLPLVESVLELIQRPASVPASQSPPAPGEAGLQVSQTVAQSDLPPGVPPLRLELRTQGPLARFLPQWRVRR